MMVLMFMEENDTLPALHKRRERAQDQRLEKTLKLDINILWTFGKKDRKLGVSIDSIKPSRQKEWARMSENGCAYQDINNYKRSSLKASAIAIQDDLSKGRIHLFQLKAVLDDDTLS